MMKNAIMTVLLMLIISLSPFAVPTLSFEDGIDEITILLVGPDYKAVANLKFPSDYYLSSATMNITGMRSETNPSAYPCNVTVRLNNTDLWCFREPGFGPLGMQNIFSTGQGTVQLAFDRGGGSKNISVRFPRNASAVAANLDLTGISPPDRYELAEFVGINSLDYFGTSVSGAGDTNNDGYDDLIVGAKGYDSNMTEVGRVYLFFGGSEVDSLPDLVLTGSSSQDFLGNSVAGVGDVNRDGFDDILVGEYGHNVNAGAVFLYFGKQNMNDTPDITFVMSGTPDQFGSSVSGAGDVNGDGYDDVIIGAQKAHPTGNSIGRAYIFFGGLNMDNIPDVTMTGEGEYDMFGSSVSDAGDLNGDGYSDIIVGAPYNDAGANNAGRAYVYFGGPTMDDVPDVIMTGIAADDNLGYSVSSAGDVNGDGCDDVVVGAPFNNAGGADAGCAYLFLGAASMDGTPDIIVIGEATGDQFGSSVSGAGDLNRDGFDEVVVARNREGNESAYVYFGNASMDDVVDFKFIGGGASSQRVSCAGDVNNDTYDDIIVGDQANQATHFPGRAFVYTAHLSNSGGILNPGISIGTKVMWNRTGIFNGTVRSSDFSTALNDYIRSATCSTTDEYGNSYVDVPLRVTAGNAGMLNIANLTIYYQYNATIPDFATPINRYLAEHQGDKDATGNITVPIEIRSESAGRVKLSGLDLSRDQPPYLVNPIGPLELDEDTAIIPFLDLYKFFQDDSGPNNTLNFSIVSSTNSIQIRLWITANRYLSADSMTGDANDNWTGTVEVNVACSDCWGQRTESNQFTIRINNVNDPPGILSSPSLDAEPGKEYYYNVTAADGDNDKLDFALLDAPGNMTIDNRTGSVRWMPHGSGNYTVTVSVSDGLAVEKQDFTLTVPNRPPRITSEPPVNASTGVRYVYQVDVVDDNFDPLAWSITATGEGIAANTTRSVLEFTPNRTGNISVIVRVSDGRWKAYQNFTINVLQGNRGPEFKSVPVATAYVEWLYVYNASASDPELDKLSYSVESGPENLTVDATSGKVTWTPKSTGNFTCVLKVSDGKNGVARQQFVIHVLEAVKPSINLATPNTVEPLKGKVRFSGQVSKGTRDVVLVQVRIDGKDWKNAIGTYNWSFTLDTRSLGNGKHAFEFRVYDGKEYSDVDSAEFRVDNAAGKSGFFPMLDSWMVLLLAAALAAMALIIRRSKI